VTGPAPVRRYRLKAATWTVVREPGAPSPRLLNEPTAVAELARDFVQANDDDREHFYVILLNARNAYLMHAEVSIGSQSSTIVHPREVFGPALREGAVSLILVHKHPSGDPTPSREDLALTRKLTEAGKLLDVTVHDHVVIGNGTLAFASMAAQGFM
jgi:DNA repair protein RadC